MMNKIPLRSLFAAAVLACMMLGACTENVDDSARYIFDEYTALSYLEEHPNSYSQYVSLLHQVPLSKLSKTTVSQLISGVATTPSLRLPTRR